MKQESIDTAWKAMLAVSAVMVFAMMPMEASAAAANAFEVVLCNVVAFFTGTIGKAIATLALIIVGLGALMGKVSWGMALIVGVGVALVFGAAGIIDSLGAAGAASCSNTGVVPIP